jgi:hypothetical protein
VRDPQPVPAVVTDQREPVGADRDRAVAPAEVPVEGGADESRPVDAEAGRPARPLCPCRACETRLPWRALGAGRPALAPKATRRTFPSCALDATGAIREPEAALSTSPTAKAAAASRLSRAPLPRIHRTNVSRGTNSFKDA